MMRYQRVSPDCVPLSNGRKSSGENGKSITNGLNPTTTTSFETKGFRFRSPSRNQDFQSLPQSENNQNQKQERSSPSPSCGGSGDVLLQWGQKKRARVSRFEMRALADESSSSGHSKLPRRLESNNNKLSTESMPPPPPPQPPNFRKDKESPFLSHRNLEKRSSGVNGSPSRNSGGSSRVVSRSAGGKRSPPTPEKVDNRRMLGSSTRSSKDERPNGSTTDQMNHAPTTTPPHSEHETGLTNNTASAVDKVHEWPRIYLALTRKEKEDDFFAMKGTKLPQRPKKRAKNVDKTLQYCFPGMWLSDLSKSRYEVREKKIVKKQKRRGLKGMESMESDSE